MSNKRASGVLFLCIFLSGISGLVYEVIWAKYLSLIFGSTVYAHTLVLATFMGGLALGSFLFGKIADKYERRLTIFAWVEIGIGFFCALTPRLFVLSKYIYILAARNLSMNPVGITVIKFIIGAIIMLPPTILMGGTLPILCRFITRVSEERGRIVAKLYYLNSLGAVIGTILAGFYLVYKFGLELSILLAAFVNLLVGFGVIILRSWQDRQGHNIKTEEKGLPQDGDDSSETLSPINIRIAVIGIFISGFVAMLYEVVWIRLLATILGSSTYSFSLMLAAFISGITIGSFIISRYMSKIRSSYFAFGMCEIGIGLSLVLCLPFYGKLPYVFARLAGAFVNGNHTFAVYSCIKFFLAFLVMIIPTVILGMTLPLVSRIASKEIKLLGSKVGSVFASNTSGNILGASVTGLILMPFLGLKNTIDLGIFLNILLGAVVIISDGSVYTKNKKIAICASCFGVFLIYKLFVPTWDPASMNTQLFRPGRRHVRSYGDYMRLVSSRSKILYYKDGRDATVSVVRDVKDNIALFINGKADASTERDMSTQILSAQLPLLMKPKSEDVLVIGLGSGVTCGSALLHPLKSLDLIEISESVVEANRHFAEHNYNALEDERINVFIEDAKSYLERVDKKYDLIISEPSNPWISGIGALFTKEYFTKCMNSLKHDGAMVQWVQGYETNDEILSMIIRTYSRVFPEVQVWFTGIHDVLLIGSRVPVKLDYRGMEKRLAKEAIRKDLKRINVQDVFTLLNLQLASNGGIRKSIWMTGSVNSDYFPVLEYAAPRALWSGRSIDSFIVDIDERKLPMSRNNLAIKEYLKDHKITYENLRNLFDFVNKWRSFNQGLLMSVLMRIHSDYPDSLEARIYYNLFRVGSIENSYSEVVGVLDENSSSDNEIRVYGTFLRNTYLPLNSVLTPEIYGRVKMSLKRCAELTKKDRALYYRALGEICNDNWDYEEALKYLLKALRIAEKADEYTLQQREDVLIPIARNIGLVYMQMSNYDMAYKAAAKVLSIENEDVVAKAIVKYIEMQDVIE